MEIKAARDYSALGSALRPPWCPDASSPTCLVCSSNFSLTTRRHHCRACGTLLCSKCCYRIPLTELGYRRVQKVCRQCWDLCSGA